MDSMIGMYAFILIVWIIIIICIFDWIKKVNKYMEDHP